MIFGKSLKTKLDHFFGDRESLSDDDFYIRYFDSQGISKEIPVKIRKIFEDQFRADFSRISSTDDFSTELQFIWGFDSLADAEIVIAIEKEFKIQIEDSEAEKMSSIQDIVTYVWEKTKH